MSNTTPPQTASEAMCAYTYGMDRSDWNFAVSRLADEVEIDYSAVGGPRETMSREAVRTFLARLLGKPGLRVHTMLGQIFAEPSPQGGFVAYYAVRHFRGEKTFFIYGWYEIALREGRVNGLAIRVTATEGDPAVLG